MNSVIKIKMDGKYLYTVSMSVPEGYHRIWKGRIIVSDMVYSTVSEKFEEIKENTDPDDHETDIGDNVRYYHCVIRKHSKTS